MSHNIFRGGAWVGAISVLLLSLLSGGCKKTHQTGSPLAPPPVQQKAGDHESPAAPKIIACALITKEEVGAVQRATIIDAQSSAGWNGNLLASQCYYSSKEANKSVSLTLFEPDPQNSSGLEARKYWSDMFGRFTAQAAGEEQGHREEKLPAPGEEEEKKVPPKKVLGLGDEAYWLADRFGGVLYVLQRDLIIRISVGGPDTEEMKIEKSKALAQKAIARLGG